MEPHGEPGTVEEQPESRTPKRRRNTVSNLFAVAAVVFGILAVVLYLRDSRGGVAPVPTAAPGHNQIVNVTTALKQEGLQVEQPPGQFIPVGELAVPGQGIEINGHPGFVFLFADTAAAQAAVEDIDVDRLAPDRIAGTPAPEGQRFLAQASNVLLLLIGADDETWEAVQRALGTLP